MLCFVKTSLDKSSGYLGTFPGALSAQKNKSKVAERVQKPFAGLDFFALFSFRIHCSQNHIHLITNWRRIRDSSIAHMLNLV